MEKSSNWYCVIRKLPHVPGGQDTHTDSCCMKLYETTWLYSNTLLPSILTPSIVVAKEYFLPVIAGVYDGFAWVRTRCDLWTPLSAGTCSTTGVSSTCGGVSNNGGLTLPSSAGAKARSISSVSAGVGSCSCTGSTPGILSSPSVSSVCTPGRSPSSTRAGTSLLSYIPLLITSPIMHPV